MDARLELADFDEPFRALYAAVSGGRRVVLADAGAREIAPHVFAVPMLTPERCRALLAQIDERRAAWRATGGTLVAPNSMHEHGAVLGEIGLGALLDDLALRWIAPLAPALFPEFVGAGIDSHHGYLVEYASDADEELGFHVDDSAVTVNLCLGEQFDGAELVMLGLRCDTHRQTPVLGHEVVEIEHVVGTAILHAGCHRHRVDPIRRGRRRNLILWCRDSTVVRTGNGHCPDWCDWKSNSGAAPER